VAAMVSVQVVSRKTVAPTPEDARVSGQLRTAERAVATLTVPAIMEPPVPAV
jgi:hypothetical protein